MDILMAAIAFSEALRDTLAKQNPCTTIEETVERLIPTRGVVAWIRGW
jgi:hypothetical protein